MPHSNYRVTQERVVIVSASGPSEANRRAIKLFDKKDCYIREPIAKKEK